MIKQFFFISVCSLSCFLVACTVIPPPETTKIPEEIRKSNAKEIAIGDKILTSIIKRDYKEFADCMKNGPAAQVTEKDFQTSLKNFDEQFGIIKRFQFITALQTPAVKNLIWKVSFERKSKEGRIINQEILFRLVTGFDDSKLVVLSFGFL